ncbi:Aste57867_18560 [Aphanomyces stellatus]|uniref:Aste57867_18560 protein n=1 Tax=Aphanomyces stellatus TaxID=120398 RepID=A0A485LAR7_9STRA|nr:hypothetical protein As57867_018498 [Aphanomyces stellatus]VFT95296.1 Aste57867_18560 [Aphanomyces stellatus]
MMQVGGQTTSPAPPTFLRRRQKRPRTTSASPSPAAKLLSRPCSIRPTLDALSFESTPPPATLSKVSTPAAALRLQAPPSNTPSLFDWCEGNEEPASPAGPMTLLSTLLSFPSSPMTSPRPLSRQLKSGIPISRHSSTANAVASVPQVEDAATLAAEATNTQTLPLHGPSRMDGMNTAAMPTTARACDAPEKRRSPSNLALPPQPVLSHESSAPSLLERRAFQWCEAREESDTFLLDERVFYRLVLLIAKDPAMEAMLEQVWRRLGRTMWIDFAKPRSDAIVHL